MALRIAAVESGADGISKIPQENSLQTAVFIVVLIGI
jgi:hypothetical protein